jgi:membrane protein YqaA with SNARE-associated domain
MLAAVLKIIANYVFVQSCIILFMLPFYAVYRRRYTIDGNAKAGLNQHLENFFLSKQANYLVFFWAMGEALVWFVIPEFLLLLMIFMRIRRKKELLVYDVAGTVTGTVIAFFANASYATIAHLPYIQTAMINQTLAWYHQLGVWGMIYQPFSGVPYKVFTLTAANFHFFLPYFIVVAVLVRMSRYLIAYGLFIVLYPGLHRYVKRNYVWLFLVATFIFSALLLRVSDSYAHHHVSFYSHSSLVRPSEN